MVGSRGGYRSFSEGNKVGGQRATRVNLSQLLFNMSDFEQKREERKS